MRLGRDRILLVHRSSPGSITSDPHLTEIDIPLHDLAGDNIRTVLRGYGNKSGSRLATIFCCDKIKFGNGERPYAAI